MRLLFTLIGVSLKTNFGLTVLREKYWRHKERLWQPILILATALFGFGTIAWLFGQLAYSLVQVGNAYGQPEIVYTLAILGTQLLLLVIGLFLVISAFYFSNDLPILVPLPIRPAYIVIAKLAVVVVNEYVTGLFLFAPAAIAYIRVIGAGAAHLLTLIGVFLLTPILPLAISAAVAFPLMRIVNRRNRDTLMVIGSLLIVVVSLSFSFLMQSAAGENTDPQAMLQQMLSSRYGLIQAIGNRFPPAIWATKAIAQAGTVSGLLNLLAFMGITVLGVLAIYAISGRLFYSGLIGGDEVARSRKKLSQSDWQQRTGQQSVLRALFWREWKIFIRTPIFALNGFLGALIMPLALVMPLLAQNQLTQMLQALESDQNAFFAALGVAALIMFMGSINTITSTSISREGKLLYISRMLPASPKLQAEAKLLHGLAGAVISSVPIVLTYWFLIKPSLLNLLFSVLIGLVGTMLGMTIGLYVDMRKPYLSWTNPQQAVKQNFNALVPMFLMMVILGASALATIKLAATGLPFALLHVLLLLLLALPGIVAYRFVVNAADRLYRQMEN